MSYIVPGDKPDSCMFCPYNVVDRKHRMTVCKFIPDSYKYDNDLKQYADCPLIEVPTPHGRLGDLDELIKKYGDWYTEEGTESGYIGTMKSLLKGASTVIEAED